MRLRHEPKRFVAPPARAVGKGRPRGYGDRGACVQVVSTQPVRTACTYKNQLVELVCLVDIQDV